jgi:hypothetical protein
VSGWPGIKAVLRGKPEGIEKKPYAVAWNRCSGTSAINLAYHFGAARIVLLGFDMRRIEREDNWHDEHKRMHPNTTRKRTDDRAQRMYARYMACMGAVARDAKDMGLEIINATPGSAITDFEFARLEDIVNEQ